MNYHQGIVDSKEPRATLDPIGNAALGIARTITRNGKLAGITCVCTGVFWILFYCLIA